MKSSLQTFLVICIMTFSFKIYATTIVPFENLGLMALNSTTVVKAHVTDVYEKDINNTIREWAELTVTSHIKGNLYQGSKFIIQNYHVKIGDIERTVAGDTHLESGKTYLLFITEMYEGVYQTNMLSYATFEETIKNGETLLLPMDMGVEVNLKSPNGNIAEKLGVYKSQKMVEMLKSVVNDGAAWNQSAVLSNYKLSDFAQSRMLPDHCSTLSGGTIARWEDIETAALPIYYQEDLDEGCSNTVAQLDNAIEALNTNYTGLSLVNAGSHDFSPTCNGEGANDDEFTAYILNEYGDSRRHLIQFNDPCNEITDLSGCSGVLAVGGLYWSNSEYEANGQTFRRALYGHVIVNNGAGACQCNNEDYAVLLTHEITHGLNIGHIGQGAGDANMNPSCCNEISDLDIECLDFIYEPAEALPITLDRFDVKMVKDEARLTWSTFSEINNDFFTVERRIESGEFVKIGSITGSATSLTKSSYEFVDSSPERGVNYYRLLQTDLDGTVHEIGIRTISNFSDFEMQIFPNPVKNNRLIINTSVANEAFANLQIYSIRGTKMYQNDITLVRGVNQTSVDVSNFAPGIYFARLSKDGSTEMLKFIK